MMFDEAQEENTQGSRTYFSWAQGDCLEVFFSELWPDTAWTPRSVLDMSLLRARTTTKLTNDRRIR